MESESRTYAQKIVELSTKDLNAEDMIKSFVDAGYTVEESREYVNALVSRLKSKYYIRMIENIYIEEFSPAELKELSEVLSYPVFSKFLAKRQVIQGKMLQVLNSQPKQ